MYDIIFKNAEVIDGTGSKPYIADVAVLDGKITLIANGIDEKAEKVIDCTNKQLSPGFIDSHSHSDLLILADPGCEAKLKQGVTTEIAGQCGNTLGPVSKTNYEKFNATSAVTAFSKADRSEFTSIKKVFEYYESLDFGTNQLNFVGHGTIRQSVMGFENRAATKQELNEMIELLEEAMRSGAIGLSTGLAYAPGNFTPHEEIVELCKIVKKYNGIYVTHMRNQSNLVLECIKDNIEIAKITKCKVCISHIKCIGKSNWGKMQQAIELIEKARKDGLDIWCDVYPYVAGATTLTVTLPPSILAGGTESTIEKLKDIKYQEYIKSQFQKPTENFENALGENGYENFLVALAPNTPNANGKTLQEIADEANLDPFDAYIKLLIDNDTNIFTVNFVMSEDDLKLAIRYEHSLIGSDGVYVKGQKQTHPRGIGTFTRFLGRYARELNYYNKEDAIRKLTGLVADKFRLESKGYIQEGFDADIVVFDWDTIIDTADFKNSLGENIGIEYVVVNGHIAIENDKVSEKLNGKLLRRVN